MSFNKIKNLVCATLIATTSFSITATAQSLQSVSSYRKAHSDMLAKQTRIKERIRLEEAQKYAQDLYEEVEPEPDIYTEGWNSGLVKPYKDMQVPNSKRIDVRH